MSCSPGKLPRRNPIDRATRRRWPNARGCNVPGLEGCLSRRVCARSVRQAWLNGKRCISKLCRQSLAAELPGRCLEELRRERYVVSQQDFGIPKRPGLARRVPQVATNIPRSEHNRLRGRPCLLLKPDVNLCQGPMHRLSSSLSYFFFPPFSDSSLSRSRPLGLGCSESFGACELGFFCGFCMDCCCGISGGRCAFLRSRPRFGQF